MYFSINGTLSPGRLVVWHNATLKGKIIIRISIKILFKSYLLIEYIPVMQFMVSHLFKKNRKGVLNSLNMMITLSFISTCTFLPQVWSRDWVQYWELFTILSPVCDCV